MKLNSNEWEKIYNIWSKVFSGERTWTALGLRSSDFSGEGWASDKQEKTSEELIQFPAAHSKMEWRYKNCYFHSPGIILATERSDQIFVLSVNA